jgi:hypothetical protein
MKATGFICLKSTVLQTLPAITPWGLDNRRGPLFLHSVAVHSSLAITALFVPETTETSPPVLLVDGISDEMPAPTEIEMSNAWLRDATNPKGIATSSPGLRGTSYPGKHRANRINPERVTAFSRE